MRNLQEDTITEAVLQTMAGTEDPRLKEVMTSLVKHMHAFAREVGLRPDEWMRGIQYLYDAGKMSTPERNEFILTSDILGLSALVDMIKGRDVTTGTEYSLLGPFFVDGAPEVPVGGDLAGDDPGTEVVLTGRILNEAHEPVEGARIEFGRIRPTVCTTCRKPMKAPCRTCAATRSPARTDGSASARSSRSPTRCRTTVRPAKSCARRRAPPGALRITISGSMPKGIARW